MGCAAGAAPRSSWPPPREAARTLGARRIVLDTRHDLVEARALYARLGYLETPPHNDRAYAERWFAKQLS